ncbi:hypothetical protein BH18VER1_BH18VER1_07640 [soil metagenome]
MRFAIVIANQDLHTKNLSIYLNDHLAGSLAALELIEHVASNYPDSHLETFLGELHAEVSADQDVLRDLLNTFEAQESTVRKAGAWLAEKLGEVKLGLTEHQVKGTGLLEALEGLALGITGKQLLWRALAAGAENVPALSGLDYSTLEKRAAAQRDAVEEKRLAAAREAFRSAPEQVARG